MHVSFHFDDFFIQIFLIDAKGRWSLSRNHNFTLKSFIFFLKIVEWLVFDYIKIFSKLFVVTDQLYLLSYKIILQFFAVFCFFFLVRMLLPAIFILLENVIHLLQKNFWTLRERYAIEKELKSKLSWET